MRKVFIYLSGSIKKDVSKSTAASGSFWTAEDLAIITTEAASKGLEVVYLSPASRSDDLSDEKSIFGRDLLQVALSDLVLADGRDRKGVGIGYEIAFANTKKIPVVSWIPPGSHYNPESMEMLGQRLTDWKHPFFSRTSTIVPTLTAAVETIATLDFSCKQALTPTDYPFFDMIHYIRTQLKRDTEMDAIITANAELSDAIDTILSLDISECDSMAAAGAGAGAGGKASGVFFKR